MVYYINIDRPLQKRKFVNICYSLLYFKISKCITIMVESNRFIFIYCI